jgi:L-2-hydroxyglutarate oxidase LhgO
MQIGTTIIGAGVVGLAIAAELSSTRKGVFLLESHPTFGQETSSRNSEVIHAGIYYPKGSLKARLCVEGNQRLYHLCATHRIAHRKCGKLIVATCKEEEPELEIIRQKALENGVTDLEELTSKQIKALEPAVQATCGLHSQSTGIIDSHRLMRHFAAQAQRNGVNLVYQATVERVEKLADFSYRVHVVYPDGQRDSFRTAWVINCAGLQSDRVAAGMAIDIDACGYRLHYWKGEYFSLDAAPLFLNHLVYPVPPPNHVGLGIHATIDLAGRVKFGPNAVYLPERTFDYTVDRSVQPAFHEAIQRYLPSVRYEDLNPEMAGIRPKLQKPGDGVRDFIIAEESSKGLAGVVNLVGIESPGLTASPAIAAHVRDLIAACQ